jgi:hypothetical protein
LAGLPTAFIKNSYEGPVSILSLPRPPPVASDSQVIDGLSSIKTTPYESSFLSRLSGVLQDQTHGVLAVDWESVTPWMSLMNDIKTHYSIAQYVFLIFKTSDSRPPSVLNTIDLARLWRLLPICLSNHIIWIKFTICWVVYSGRESMVIHVGLIMATDEIINERSI